MSDWTTALKTVRDQMADYEREGTSTPGKLKRAGRVRSARMALREFAASHAEPTARLKALLNDVEKAEKDDDWRKISGLVPQLVAVIDELAGAMPE